LYIFVVAKKTLLKQTKSSNKMKKITTLLSTLVLFTHVFSQTTVGMVAYFPLNGTVTDVGPNSIVGTNFGATATTNRVGTANSAMNFVNPSSVVSQHATHAINTNTSFGTNQNFTIAFACIVTSTPRAGGLYDNNLNYGGPGLFVWNSNGFPQINFNFKNGNIGSTNGALPLNTWKHVAAVRNGTVTQIYINGVLNATGAPGSTTPVYSFPARIGTMFFNGFSPPPYNGLNGKMDELRIYNRALTAAEILVLSTTALPIKLTSFTASTQQTNVLLKWQTASESNTQHYLVQRSNNGTNFLNIATVKAKGNSVNNTTYTHTDGNVLTTVNSPIIYYRLQAVDIDGKTQFSPVVSVGTISKSDDIVLLQNPVKNNINLQLNVPQKENVVIAIVNASGQLLHTQPYQLQAGKTVLSLPCTNLSSGIYYLTVHYKNSKQTITVLKE
jgi:Concanavalin A-like lectin/glucanases superfamily/Secretion system C-terminal sorting domain